MRGPHMRLTSLIVILLTFSFVASSQPLERLTRHDENVLTMVGYIGLADFCWAYGVDYRELAHRVKDSIIEDAEQKSARYERLVYLAFEAAARGNIYSRSVGDMINLSDSTDTRQACDNMYAQFQRIARMR